MGKGRRGTKSNPFAVGEVVLVKRLKSRGVVTSVRIADYSMPWEFPRYEPIRYMVRHVDRDLEEEYSARDLAAVIDEPPLPGDET
jgi:hypothetical protein